MACVNQDNPECPNCNKNGLAILPVRYAVVPGTVDVALPSGLGNKVVDVALKHHKYGLRTLRQGFLYLFFEKHPHGSHIKWEVYSVEPGGTLWKQISTASTIPVDGVMCSRKGHNIPASIITIPSPEKCGRVWMAFSEHRWSERTFQAFERDSQLRDRRMQTFAPSIWIKSKGYRHGMEANEANLNEVIEYRSGFPLSKLGLSNITEISKPDGSYDKAGLNSCATRYQISVRRDDKARVAALMRQVGERPNLPGHVPIVIALWDHVGITQELNGFRNDAIGWIEKYSKERELEITALAAIEGARQALDQREIEAETEIVESNVFKWDPESTRKRVGVYQRENPHDTVGLARQRDLCERWELDAAQRVPRSIARRREQYVRMNEEGWRRGMAEVDESVKQAMSPSGPKGKSTIEVRDEHIKQRSAEASITAARIWRKYESKLDMSALTRFKESRTSFLRAATAIANERTEDLVRWLQSRYLVDALLEFDTSDILDGIAFEASIAEMIFGISSSPAGRKLLQQWVMEGKASDHNLLWRSVALNQQEGRDAVDGAMAVATKSPAVASHELVAAAIADSTKHFAKLSDLAKKGLSLHNTLRKSGVYRVPTGGIEKILVAVGDSFFQPFIQKKVDGLSRLMVFGLLWARAGCEHGRITAVLLAEAAADNVGRAKIFDRYAVGQVFSRYVLERETSRLSQAWADLAKDADTPKGNANPKLAGGFNEAKELRFGIVVVLFQLMNVSRLLLEANRDPRGEAARGELFIAGLSLSAGMSDLVATVIKGLHSDSSLTFQAFKLSGGLLGAGIAWAQFHQDIGQAKNAESEGKEAIVWLYRAKAGLALISGICSLLTAISYTKPAFDLIASRCPGTVLGRAAVAAPKTVSSIAGRLMFGRAALIFGGIFFGVLTIVIQALIWRFSDDALEEWLHRCAFGKDRQRRFCSPGTQMNQFENALLEVM